MAFDLKKVKKIYFVGIKGVAMAALAIYAKELGLETFGSDTSEQFPSDEELSAAGIVPLVGFDPVHLQKIHPDLIIYTGAHGGIANIEVQEAKKMNIPVLPHGRALGLFMEGKRQICVAGSHGKTTTASMIAVILSHAGYNPSYAVGCGSIAGLGPAGHYGKGQWFVAEADEYLTDPGHDNTPRFLWLRPEILVVTNIDYDHPDAYASLDEVKISFRKFMDRVKNNGHVIINANDKETVEASEGLKNRIKVGKRFQIKAEDVRFENGVTYFILNNGETKIPVSLHVPGIHNVNNAVLAAEACSLTGVPWDKIAAGLSSFKGTKRRFEKLREVAGVTFYDDYAHHPEEIVATLAGAKAWFPKKRIIAVFQSHTYSRTKALEGEFSKSFSDADKVLLTDIYASARERDTLGITGEVLAVATQKHHPQAYYAKDKNKVMTFLQKELRRGDVVIFMGAGDIYRWGRELTNKLQMK